MTTRIDDSLHGIDWVRATADDFDNGRSPKAQRSSFDQSQDVARAGSSIVRRCSSTCQASLQADDTQQFCASRGFEPQPANP